MAPLAVPPELKKITQFVRRAEELDADTTQKESRVVAYYCRQYAVQQGIPVAGSSDANKACLGTLLNQLETEKAAMSVFTRLEAKLICRSFADKVFERGDAQDRAGMADKNTAKTFYAAASFYDILQQFYGDETLDPEEVIDGKTIEQAEEEERRVYAKWKATEILKAIREGRKPTPGGFGDNGTAGIEDEDPDIAALGASRSMDPMLHSNSEADLFIPPPSSNANFSSTDIPPAPAAAPPPPPSYDQDQGTEVVLGQQEDAPAQDPPPPPSYEMANLPPPMAPPPQHQSRSTSTNKPSGFWNRVTGSKSPTSSSSKASKQAIEDAAELTNFALAALHNKEPDLAVQRLEEALRTLKR